MILSKSVKYNKSVKKYNETSVKGNLVKATGYTVQFNRPDSFVLMLRYFANLKAIRYESTSLNRIVADKSHREIVAWDGQSGHERSS